MRAGKQHSFRGCTLPESGTKFNPTIQTTPLPEKNKMTHGDLKILFDKRSHKYIQRVLKRIKLDFRK